MKFPGFTDSVVTLFRCKTPFVLFLLPLGLVLCINHCHDSQHIRTSRSTHNKHTAPISAFADRYREEIPISCIHSTHKFELLAGAETLGIIVSSLLINPSFFETVVTCYWYKSPTALFLRPSSRVHGRFTCCDSECHFQNHENSSISHLTAQHARA
ncbi:hypothetical protein PM082_013575 [Marasmius tenuissimus]|nr:hypothetical protein PM082_013575 [Marasmius tenuissimus]